MGEATVFIRARLQVLVDDALVIKIHDGRAKEGLCGFQDAFRRQMKIRAVVPVVADALIELMEAEVGHRGRLAARENVWQRFASCLLYVYHVHLGHV